MTKIVTEIKSIVIWAKNHLLQAFLSISAIGALCTSLVAVYSMYQDVRSIPRLKAAYTNEIDSMKNEIYLNTRILNITIDALSEEMETIQYKNYHIEKTNSGDYWYFLNKGNRVYLFSANYKKKDNKFYYFDFNNQYNVIGDKQMTRH